MITITGPDGAEIDFPDNTSPETMQRAMQAQYGGPRERTAVPVGRDIVGLSAATTHGYTGGLVDELSGAVHSVVPAVQGFVEGLPVSERMDVNGRVSPNTVQDRLRAAGQAGSTAFHDAAQEVRSNLSDFRRRRPVASTAAEVVGSLYGPGNAVGGALERAGVAGFRNAAATGALLGGEYALATGDTMQERLDPLRLATSVGTGVALGTAGEGLGRYVLGPAADAAVNIAARAGLNPSQRAVRMINRGLQRQTATEDDLYWRGAQRADARALANGPDAPPMEAQDLVNRARYVQARNRGTRANPSPMALMNFELMGQQGVSQANALANVAGPGRDIASRAFAARTNGDGGDLAPFMTQAAQRALTSTASGRPGTVSDRMLAAARRALPTNQTRVPQNYDEYAEALQQTRAGQAREAYRAGLARDPEPHAVARRLIPQIQGMPQAARQAAARSGANQLEFEIGRLNSDRLAAQSSGSNRAVATLDEQIARAQQGLEHLRAIEEGRQVQPNIWGIDYFQRGLQQFERSLGGGTPEAGAVAAARRRYVEAARQLAPAWGEAHAQYGQSMRLSDLVEQGRSILRSPESMDQVVRVLRSSRLSVDERDALIVGTMDALDSKLAQGDTRFAAQLLRRRDWQDAMRQIMGDENWERFYRSSLLENFMKRNENAVMGNSKTARTQEDMRDLTNESEMSFMRDALQSGDLRGAVARRALDAWDRWAQGGVRNPEVNREMARRVFATATPGNVRSLADEISALPSYARLRPASPSLARGLGRTGAALGATTVNNSDAPWQAQTAEMSGVPDLVRSGESLARGDYADAAANGIGAGLALAPMVSGASLPIKLAGLAGGAGVVTTAAANAAEAQRRQVRDDVTGFTIEVGGTVPPWRGHVEQVGQKGDRVVMRFGANGDYMFRVSRDAQGQLNNLEPLGRVVSRGGPEPSRYPGPGETQQTEPSMFGPLGGIAGNLAARAIARRIPGIGPIGREALAFGGGAGVGALAEGATGHDPRAGAVTGAMASLVASPFSIASRQIRQAGGARALTGVGGVNRRAAEDVANRSYEAARNPAYQLAPPRSARVRQGRAVQEMVRTGADQPVPARSLTTYDRMFRAARASVNKLSASDVARAAQALGVPNARRADMVSDISHRLAMENAATREILARAGVILP
jgi:hypothetical protein